jgi:hypothetical protein
MTQPDDGTPPARSAGPDGEHGPDRAEDYAESVPIDPSPDEVSHYLDLIGDPDADPAEQDTGEQQP